MADQVTVFAPASIANVGPCYDLFGYGLQHVGDFAVAEKIDRQNETLVWGGVEGVCAAALSDVPPRDNVAWVVAHHIIQNHLSVRASREFSIKVTLHKYLPLSSGLGSSAASGVAAAKAILSLLGLDLDVSSINHALGVGEQHACGTPHLDNAVPSFYGGAWLLCPKYSSGALDGTMYRLPTLEKLFTVVVKPRNASISTREGRERVREWILAELMGTESDPGEIISLVTLQAAKAADMVLAFMHQDLDRLGWIVHHNPMLEAARGPAIPNFQEIKTAGKKAGAAGVSIAGSGPSVFAITDSRDTALRVLDAMLQAADTECHWLISPMGNTGATTVTSITAFVQAGLADTNFMQ